jgi:hypothetical protein
MFKVPGASISLKKKHQKPRISQKSATINHCPIQNDNIDWKPKNLENYEKI